MPANPKFIPILTPYGWMVSIPASLSGEKKRRKKYFSTEPKAERYAAKLRRVYASGVRSAVIPVNLALQAMEAMKVLEGSGLSLLDAARIAKGQILDSGSAQTFDERLLACWLANEGVWSDRYDQDMGKIRTWVPKWFLKMQCGAITRETMVRALTENHRLSQSTIDARCRYLSAALNHRPRHRKSSEIQILTKQQCRALLRACESKAEVWAVSLLLFAGIRPDAEQGEIKRLDWANVGENEIYVSSEVAKTNSDRHIPILPRLARLLRKRPKAGPVTPPNWRRVWRRIRATAGTPDHQDICRHTFGSMLLAYHGGNEGPVKLSMGHTASSSTLFRYYRRAVSIEDGKKYFR